MGSVGSSPDSFNRQYRQLNWRQPVRKRRLGSQCQRHFHPGGSGGVNLVSASNITIGQTPLSGSIIGANSWNNTGGGGGSNVPSGSRFTTSGGTISSMSVYFTNPTGGDKYQFAVYSDGDRRPWRLHILIRGRHVRSGRCRLVHASDHRHPGAVDILLAGLQ